MLHPALVSLSASLDAAGVRWTLMRLPSVPHAPTGDIDLLVDPASAPALADVLSRHGFVALPGWTRFPTLLFVGLDQPSGQAFLLDVTDRVAFGPDGRFATDVAARLLAGSHPADGTRLPADDDAFWALLLHCLLDKARVPEHYRDRLRSGASAADPEHPLAGRLRDAPAVLAAVRGGRWPAVEAAAGPAAARCRAELTAGDRVRAQAGKARRRLAAPLLLRRRYGVSVALLGPNGAGKSTLAEGIAASWPLPVRRVYLGLWKSGEGTAAEIPGLAQVLRVPTAWGRYLTAVSAQLRGQLVVFDRYVHDARRPPAPPYLALKRGYMWVLGHCIPDPDVVLLLDLPGAVSYARKAENSVAEGDLEQRELRAVAAQLASVHVLDATRSADEVRGDALRVIWARCLTRWGYRPARTSGQDAGR